MIQKKKGAFKKLNTSKFYPVNLLEVCKAILFYVFKYLDTIHLAILV